MTNSAMEESYGLSCNGRAIMFQPVQETQTSERGVRIAYVEASGNRFTGVMRKGCLQNPGYTSPTGEELQPGRRDTDGFDELGALLIERLPQAWQGEFGHWFHKEKAK